MRETLVGLTKINVKNATKRALVVVGATHGNEPAGVQTIDILSKLITSKDWIVKDCDVHGLIGNPEALRKNTRFTDENLNRAFGKNSPLTYESRRAYEIEAWFEVLSQEYTELFLIDIHSVSIGDVRMIICDETDQYAQKLITDISPIPLRIVSKEMVLPGSLMSAFHKRGGVALAIECGNHSSAEGSTVALEHIELLLTHIGALTNAKTSFKHSVSYTGTERTYLLSDIIRPTQGFAWTREVSSELFLKQGEMYARDPQNEYSALYDCYMLMPSKHPEPNDFDAGFFATRL